MSTPTLTAPAATGTARRLRVPAVLRHSVTLAGRSLITTRRTPEALLDVTLQPLIFLVLFTYLLGGAISGGDRGDYLQYLLPGILGQSIAMAGIAVGVNLASDLEKGVFDRFRSLPISRAAPLVGMVLADLVRYALLTTVIFGVGMLMGFRVETGVGQMLIAVVLAMGFALCFAWISVFIGTRARSAGAVQGIAMLIALPLSFASSTFVDPATMPGWLQTVVAVNPLTQLVDTMRGLLLGGPVAEPMLWTLLGMGVLLAVFVPLAMRGYARRT